MPQEYHSLLSQHGVDEDNDRMGKGPARSEVGMDGKRLWRGRMRSRKDLDELDEGKIAHNLRPNDRRHLDRNRNVVVDDLRLKLVGISG